MKTIFIFLLFFGICFGQYGKRNITNGTFETYSGTPDDGNDDAFIGHNLTTTAGISEASVTSGYNITSLILHNNTGNNRSGLLTTQINVPLSASTPHRLSFWTRGDGGSGSIEYRLYDAANTANIVQTSCGLTGATYQFFSYNFTTAANFTNTHAYLYGTSVNGDSVFVDEWAIREKLDTLWTDTAQADETDNDSTKTLTEAFVTRGAHSGGYFITAAGTYDETFAIDSSFTKWEASGVATVTSVDFNSVTCTVDTRYLTITTATNDDNVTYIDSTPAATEEKHGYGGYLNRRGFGGW